MLFGVCINLMYNEHMEEEKRAKLLEKFNNINVIFAYIVCLMPLFCILFGGFVNATFNMQLFLFFFAYLVFLVFHLPILVWTKDLKSKIKKMLTFPTIVALVLFFWFILTSIMHNEFGHYFWIYMSYIALYICFRRLDKSHYKKLFYVFVGTLMLSCVLSLIFPNSHDVPGFYTNARGYSMQFANPNFSSYLIGVVLMGVIAILSGKTNTFEKVYLTIAYVLFSWWLYANGSFAPIAGVYGMCVILTIVKWIKEKKCPWKLIAMFVAQIPMALLIDLCPWWTVHRNTSANFLVECLAVFDNIFGTDLYNRATGNPGALPGADGWDRMDLFRASFAGIFASAYRCIFGYGSGHYGSFGPHNQLVALWVDGGIVYPICLILIIGYWFIRYFKTKFDMKYFVYFAFMITYVFVSYFGSMVYYVFAFIVPIIAVSYTTISHKDEVVDIKAKPVRHTKSSKSKTK